MGIREQDVVNQGNDRYPLLINSIRSIDQESGSVVRELRIFLMELSMEQFISIW